MLKKFGLILLLSNLSFNLNAQDTDSIYSNDSFDQSLFRKLNGHRTAFLDIVIPIAEKTVTIPSIVVPVSLYISSRFTDNYYDENSSSLLAISNGLNFGVTIGVKEIVRRNRPMLSMDDIYFDKDFFKGNDRHSFPSGHASTTFNTAALLTLRYPDNPGLITGFYLRALAVSFGRIYIGAHYPGDVITGAIVGTGTAFLVYTLRKEIIELKADVFNQQERKEIGSDKVNQYVALGSMLALDLFNYFILGQKSKITKNMRIDLGMNGSANTLNFSYHF